MRPLKKELQNETLKERATEFMLQRGWKRLTAKHREFEQSLFEHTMVELDALLSLLPYCKGSRPGRYSQGS